MDHDIFDAVYELVGPCTITLIARVSQSPYRVMVAYEHNDTTRHDEPVVTLMMKLRNSKWIVAETIMTDCDCDGCTDGDDHHAA